MELINKIAAHELNMFDSWRADYVLNDSNGIVAPVEKVLKLWEKGKQNLFTLFGGHLMLTKEVSFAKSQDELSRNMDDAIHGYGSAARTFVDSWSDFFYNRLRGISYRAEIEEYNKWSDLEDMMSITSLVSNTYIGCTHTITLPDGSDLKIQHGCKVSKAMGKIAAAFGLKGYEEFRIIHSQALNQKKLTGRLTLSIHPLDYVTMSDNECGWGSCMSWRDYGEYRRGTVEMMNSPCVIVAYLTAADPMYINNYEWSNKKWRELFVVDKTVLAGIKGYPYRNENLEKEVLNWLKELAETNWGFKYEKDVVTLEMDDDREGFVANRDIKVRFYTDAMYNDFYDNHLAILGENVTTIELNYSGLSQCMSCGCTDVDFDECGDLACCACNDTCHCYNCGERISADAAYEVDGNMICEYCYMDLETCDVCQEKAFSTRRIGIMRNGQALNTEFCMCDNCLDDEVLCKEKDLEYNDAYWRRGPRCYIDYDKLNQNRERYIRQLFGCSTEELEHDLANPELTYTPQLAVRFA